MDITDRFQELSIQSDFIKETAEMKCAQFECGTPLIENCI